MSNPRTQTLIFVNNTNLPILVSSWREKSMGLSEYIDITILSNTQQTVYSDVGEWILGSQFYIKELDQQWKNEGLYQYGRIAKFRNQPCVRGEYTWNFIEEAFILEYNNGVITWSRKPKSDS